VKTPEQMAQNWVTAMAAPSTSAAYRAGIANTAVNPMQLAASAEAQEKYANATAEAVRSGRMRERLNAVPKEYWQSQSDKIGAMNLANGGKKGQAKQLAWFRRAVSIYPQMKAASRAITGTGFSAASARSSAALRVLMEATGRA
jgi:hypothetical protein